MASRNREFRFGVTFNEHDSDGEEVDIDANEREMLLQFEIFLEKVVTHFFEGAIEITEYKDHK